jgi:hypothetical protein
MRSDIVPGAIFPDNAFRPAPGNAGRSLNCKVKIRSNSSIVFFMWTTCSRQGAFLRR